jgi:hypothetical protein
MTQAEVGAEESRPVKSFTVKECLEGYEARPPLQTTIKTA